MRIFPSLFEGGGPIPKISSLSLGAPVPFENYIASASLANVGGQMSVRGWATLNGYISDPGFSVPEVTELEYSNYIVRYVDTAGDHRSVEIPANRMIGDAPPEIAKIGRIDNGFEWAIPDDATSPLDLYIIDLDGSEKFVRSIAF